MKHILGKSAEGLIEKKIIEIREFYLKQRDLKAELNTGKELFQKELVQMKFK